MSITVNPPANVKLHGFINRYYYSTSSNPCWLDYSYLYFSFDMTSYTKDGEEISSTDKTQEFGPRYFVPWGFYGNTGLNKLSSSSSTNTGYISYGNYYLVYVDNKSDASIDEYTKLNCYGSLPHYTRCYCALDNKVDNGSKKVLGNIVISKTDLVANKVFYVHVCNVYVEKDGTRNFSEWITSSATLNNNVSYKLHYLNSDSTESVINKSGTLASPPPISSTDYDTIKNNVPSVYNTRYYISPINFIYRFKDSDGNILSEIPFIHDAQFPVIIRTDSNPNMIYSSMSDIYVSYEQPGKVSVDYNDGRGVTECKGYLSLARSGYIFDGWTFDKEGVGDRHFLGVRARKTSSSDSNATFGINSDYHSSLLLKSHSSSNISEMRIEDYYAMTNLEDRIIYFQWKPSSENVNLTMDLKDGNFTSSSTYTKEGSIYKFSASESVDFPTIPPVSKPGTTTATSYDLINEFGEVQRTNSSYPKQFTNFYNAIPYYVYGNNIVVLQCDPSKDESIPLSISKTSAGKNYSALVWPPDVSLREFFGEDFLEAKSSNSDKSFFGYYSGKIGKLNLDQKVAEINEGATSSVYTSGSSDSKVFNAKFEVSNKSHISVCNNSRFYNAKPYIYTNNEWKECEPNVCNKEKWKNTVYANSIGDLHKNPSVQSTYAVGDSLGITLNGTCLQFTADNLNLTCQILAFNHNKILETNEIDVCTHLIIGRSGSTEIALVDSNYGSTGTTGFIMNPKNTSLYGSDAYTNGGNKGGWRSCNIRNVILPTLLDNCMLSIRDKIYSIIKYSDNVGKAANDTASLASSITPTADKLFIPSVYEVFGTASSYENNKQLQYEYFKNGSSSGSDINRSCRYKHNSLTTQVSWWLRTAAYITNSNSYFYKSYYGGSSADYSNANYSYGITPCFVV